MRGRSVLSPVAWLGLAAAGLLPFLMPPSLGLNTASGQALPAEIDLLGIVRDFHGTHPDFGVVPLGGIGHYAGNVSQTLGSNQKPVFVGGGYKVGMQWRDAASRPIAPHMAGVAGMFGRFEPLGLRVNNTVTMSNNSMVDGFNSTFGPYGVMGNFGLNALVTTNSTAAGAVSVGPAAVVTGNIAVGPGGVPPDVIDNQGFITGSQTALQELYPMPDLTLPTDLDVFIPDLRLSGAVTLTGDTNLDEELDPLVPAMHVGALRFDPGAVVTISGDLRIVVDTLLRMDGAQIILLPEAVLTFYVSGDVQIDANSLVNVAPGDTTAVTINLLGPGTVTIDGDSHVFATIAAPTGQLTVAKFSQLYGSFLGDSIVIDTKAGVHVDGANAYFVGRKNFGLAANEKIEIGKDEDEGTGTATIIDSFDSNLGPYGGANVSANAVLRTNTTKSNKVKLQGTSTINGDVLVGPGGNPATVVRIMPGATVTGSLGTLSELFQIPVVTPPAVGPDVGDITYFGVTDVISTNLHCDKLKILGGSIIDIDGNVTIRCEKMEVKDGSEVRLMPGATLTVYIEEKFKLDNNSKLNMNTGNPQLVSIRRLRLGEKGKIDVKNGSQLVAWVQGGSKTKLHVHRAEFFGSFIGKEAKIHKGSMAHIDTAFMSICGGVSDMGGTKMMPSKGGISSFSTFSQWFTDVPGVNLSTTHSIRLVKDASDIYEFLTPQFYPVDNRLLGNGGFLRNHYFTYAISAEFTYEQCAGQFFEFMGSDDAWVFLNDQLVMDLGGVMPGTAQYVELDRLGLSRDKTYQLHFFYAQRQASSGAFRMRTNLILTPTNVPSISDVFD